MKIYGDSISGNCLKVKWVADSLGVSYDWIETSVLKSESRTTDFLALNPAGQVPMVVLDDGRPLAQSNAIILHLAEGSALIPTNRYERAKMLEWMFWEQYSHEPYIAVARFQVRFLGKPLADLEPRIVERGNAALQRMEDGLAEERFLTGAAVSLADVALVAYTREAEDGGFDLGAYPRVGAWIARVEAALLCARAVAACVLRRRGPRGPGLGQRRRVARHRATPVLGTGQRGRERDRRGRDQSSILAGVHPAGGGRAPVVDGLDRVLDRGLTRSSAQELEMHAGGRLRRIDGERRGRQALRHELTSEGPLAFWSARRADPRSRGGPRCQVEQRQQGAHATVPAWTSASSSSALRPSPRSTSAVSSPSAGAGTAFGYVPSIDIGNPGARYSPMRG